ncbi:MAG TPA: phosphatase PAP2 family protein [Polyangiaceae bacterium]|nr:phosphatase PAP2 family protein [Polyangiaceae bacterium]
MGLAVVTFGNNAQACEQMAPWSRLGSSAHHAITPLSAVLTVGAIAAPLSMVPTGVDHSLRLLAQRDLGGEPNLEPVSVWTPFLLPILLVGTDVVGYATSSCELVRPTSAMLQAMGATIALVVALKWTAGRGWPNAGLDPRAPTRLDHPEFARDFHWFSWKDGSAWPSGHTATMVAAATALTTATSGSWLGYVSIAAAGGVATGMWLGDHHWASDIVSGAMLGAGIGRAVGLAFRDDSLRDNSSRAASVLPTVLPWVGQSHRGIQVIASF